MYNAKPQTSSPSPMASGGRRVLTIISRHGAPLVFSSVLIWLLWWGHVPNVTTVDEAMLHVSWVGVFALIYVGLQARAILAQPRSSVMHTLIEIVVSLLPLFVVGYAMVDWLRGSNSLNVFQIIVMVQAAFATIIDVVIFTWFSLRLNKLSIQSIATHSG